MTAPIFQNKLAGKDLKSGKAVSASTLAAVELIKSLRLTGAGGAVVDSETSGAATKPDPKVFESAVDALQVKQTFAVDDDAYLMNVLVDYDALRDENEQLKSQNQGLQLQNETLQLEVAFWLITTLYVI